MEDEPPTPFALPWAASRTQTVDAFGEEIPVKVSDGQLQLQVSPTPHLYKATGNALVQVNTYNQLAVHFAD